MDHSQSKYPNPRITLRIGVIGNRNLPKATLGELTKKITDVTRAISITVESLHKQCKESAHKPEDILYYYDSDQPAEIRYVSGLANGADRLVLKQALQEPSAENIKTTIACVTPFDIDVLKNKEPDEYDTEEFRSLTENSEYTLCLDGRYEESAQEKPTESADIASQSRSRAFRAQADVLMRHSDILIAVLDPMKKSRPGGTPESLVKAIEMGIACIVVYADGSHCFLANQHSDLDELLISPPSDQNIAVVTSQIDTEISGVIADPHYRTDFPSSGAKRKLQTQEQELLGTFFDINIGKAAAELSSDRVDEDNVFYHYRERAAYLSRHFSKKYKRAYKGNYLFAVIAVFIAGLGLLGLALFGGQSASGFNKLSISEGVKILADSSTSIPEWLLYSLLILTIAKVTILVYMVVATHRANNKNWNNKSIDYRYLAERLTHGAFLANLGSYRTVSPGTTQLATRVQVQRVMDWLYQALLREAKPTSRFTLGRSHHIETNERIEEVKNALLLREQDYHSKNSQKMTRLNAYLSTGASYLGLLVLFLVSIDLVLVLLKIFHAFPDWTKAIVNLSGVLMFLAAVFPAAIASMNGYRFQSEASRLSDRSQIMIDVIERHKGRFDALQTRLQQPNNLGSWNVRAMKEMEECEQSMVKEVTEWCVLYSKEVQEG